jgi:hypothetical protein
MDYKGELKKHPSHKYLLKFIHQRKWTEVANIIRNDEIFLQVPDDDENLPVHLCVKFGCTLEIIRLVYGAFPVCLSIRDPAGYLPIHLVVQHHKQCLNMELVAMVQEIASYYPEGLTAPDPEQNLPLHLHIRCHGPENAILALIQMRPDTITVTDRFGNTPLHLAIQFGNTTKFLCKLIDMCPQNLEAVNQFGTLPFHKAVQFDSPLEVLVKCLSIFPDAIQVQDNAGNLPMHILYTSRGSPPDERKLSLLLELYPASLGVANENGLTPLMMLDTYHDLFNEYL